MVRAFALALALVVMVSSSCDVDAGLGVEPLEGHIEIEISLEGAITECDLRLMGFALWLYDGGNLALCSSAAADDCVYGPSDDCGIAVEDTGEGYCVSPVVFGCDF